MSLNCNELDAVLGELDLESCYIQEIIQPGFDTLALRAYKTGCAKTVLVCTAAGSCRLHETRRKITRNQKPLRFMEFLNSRIRGARIAGCGQLGHERIVRLELTRSGERLFMFARLWSNAANVVLCDESLTILDCLYRRPGRNEVTGQKFTLPQILDHLTDEERLAKYPVREFDGLENSESLSFNQKVDAWYGEHAASLSREAILAQAEKWYGAQRARRAAALEKLEQKLCDFAGAERLRHWGDLVLAFSKNISGNGSVLECVDYETGRQVSIPLDPQKNAHENAQAFYKKYKKARSGAEELAHDIEMAKAQLAALDDTYRQILAEQNPVRLEQLFRKSATPAQQQKKKHPGLLYTVDGWQIYVGRDAGENDGLLRHHVKGNDIWLHVRDFAGGYVFVKVRAGKTVPLEVLLDAGNLAVYFSKARKNGRADLYYTHVKYLRRAKNGPKGLVLPTQEKNLSVTLDKERLKKLYLARQSRD